MTTPRPGILLAIALLSLLLSACTRMDIYDTAIDYERHSAGLAMHTVDVNGLSIAYLRNPPIRGADTLVMLHGFGANKDNWVRMAGYLSDHYNVYAIDLPGHGDSTKTLDLGYSIADQVRYLDSILAALAIKRPHLIGNSMGGAITALYAATFPDNVQSATLFDPAGVFQYDSELVELVKSGQNPLIVEKPGDFEKLVNFALEKKPLVPWPIYSVMEDKALANYTVNTQIFAAIRDSGYQPEFRQALSRISAPVLIVWGREDRVINYRNSEVFDAEVPRSRVLILDGVGHGPMVEVPEQAAGLVRALVEQPHVTVAIKPAAMIN
ncbi:alpha/beta fold hydrolase [Marinobacter caseinilyticus]|uniref:alpha/beta fold hydrolase n=1 Tax=Marinobacter caseinilyticus TaxID=2692195 RepID=UPI00140AE57E|nr:alpha/beta fold hydrolase [Marinobacter caseinilyticus]